jgi:hypothetical protein
MAISCVAHGRAPTHYPFFPQTSAMSKEFHAETTLPIRPMGGRPCRTTRILRPGHVGKRRF